jgi:hypothetical protein
MEERILDEIRLTMDDMKMRTGNGKKALLRFSVTRNVLEIDQNLQKSTQNFAPLRKHFHLLG